MNDIRDEDIEALLLQAFDGAVSDDGFCERVMQRLPPRQKRPMWPLWMGVLLGIGGCGASLLMAVPIRAGWHDWMQGEWSAAALTLLLATAGMSLLALCWGVAEGSER